MTATMRAFMDETELALERPSQRAAFEGAIDAAQAQGRIVIEAIRDGQTVSADDLAVLPDDAGGADEIRFLTANPRTLVRVTLDEVGDALKGLSSMQTSLGERVQAGETEGVADGLREIVDVWQAARQALDHASALLGEAILAGNASGDGPTVDEATVSLAAGLTELQRALGAEDWAGVADVLLEDLAVQAETWGGMMRRISEDLKAGER